ncbi:MAG: hypothetical protein JWM33_1733 [Caulobacteraceae bacterium]|nr:hypothetical protein [Caulobacteraceae bacterium]
MTFSKIVCVILLVAVLSLLSAPFLAFRSLRAAAEAGDSSAIAALVDGGQVRQSLADQLRDRPVAVTPPPSLFQDPIGAIGGALRPLAPQPPIVDAYLTTDGFRALDRGLKPGAALPPRGGKLPLTRVMYIGARRIRFTVSPTKGADPTIFTFERRGWVDWKLVQIGLPASR